MSEEKIQLSTRQWQLLSAISFGVFGTGQVFEDRPLHALEGNVLTLKFKTTEEFRTYTRRALAITASRMIAFTVDEVQEQSVKCRALFNHTAPLQIDDSIIDMILGTTA